MSEEQLKAFLEKVQVDTSLQEKLKAAVDADAVTAIAKEAGFSITVEDIQSMQSPELSDNELEAAAGGKLVYDTHKYCATTCLTTTCWLDNCYC